MGKYRITLNGKVYEMVVEPVEDDKSVDLVQHKDAQVSWQSSRKTGSAVIQIIDPSAERKTPSANIGIVTSPMPGTVIKIIKGEGETVKKGELVLILEAMKMENEILAPVDGKVIKMNCDEGKSVEGSTVLFEIQ